MRLVIPPCFAAVGKDKYYPLTYPYGAGCSNTADRLEAPPYAPIGAWTTPYSTKASNKNLFIWVYNQL